MADCVNPSEHQEQVTFMEYMAIKHPSVVCFAIPNGEHRTARTGARLKRQGVKRGVPDILVAAPKESRHGLFIELKRRGLKARKNGGLTIHQLNMRNQLEHENYEVAVCYGADHAIQTVEEYLA